MSFEGAQRGCVGPITSCTKEPYGSLKETRQRKGWEGGELFLYAAYGDECNGLFSAASFTHRWQH